MSAGIGYDKYQDLKLAIRDWADRNKTHKETLPAMIIAAAELLCLDKESNLADDLEELASVVMRMSRNARKLNPEEHSDDQTD